MLDVQLAAALLQVLLTCLHALCCAAFSPCVYGSPTLHALQAVRLPSDGTQQPTDGFGAQHPVRVVFVGDVDQLPSVGPGAVLLDLLEAGVVPATQLTQVWQWVGVNSVPPLVSLIDCVCAGVSPSSAE